MTTPRRGRPGYDRAQILAGAVAVFNARGYDSASVAEIASELGLTKSALYHHFASKEEILATALDTALGALEATFAHPSATTGSPIDRLTFVVRAAADALLDHLPYVTLLLRVRGNSETELSALRRRREFDNRLAELVHEAQTAGALRTDIDPTRAARLVFGMLNSVVEWQRTPGASQGVADDILALTLDGLRSTPISVSGSAR